MSGGTNIGGRLLSNDQYLAIVNANLPSAANPFATIADVVACGFTIPVVANYSALPAPGTVDLKYYRTAAGENTSWRPTWLGGTYYPKGIYQSIGGVWDYVGEFPYQADQATVDAGINNDEFVTPLTLANSTQWASKADTIHTHLTSDVTGLDTLITHALGSGIITGGEISINADDTKFDVQAGRGYVIDNSVYPPTRVEVVWTTQTAVSTPYLATDDNTFIAIDSTGTLVLTNTIQDFHDLPDVIVLGWVEHTNGTNIEFALTEPYFSPDTPQQINQFFEAFGPFNITGNDLTPNGVNLQIDISAGKIFDNGTGYSQNKKSVNIFASNQIIATDIYYYYQDGLGGWNNSLAAVTSIDPENYDDGSGTLQPVSTGKFTIQYAYYYAPAGNIDILYGQNIYDTLADAKSGLNDTIVVNEFLRFNIFKAWIIVKQGCTDISDNTECLIINSNRFSSITGSLGDAQGEVNTASNVGTSGVGVYDSKMGVDLQLRNLNSLDARLTIALDAPNKKIDFNLSNIQTQLNGTGFVKIIGTTISYDNSAYLTGNQSITLSGDATGSGTTSITVSIGNTIVTGKLLTGYVSGAGIVAATDSILQAIQKLNGNIGALVTGVSSVNGLTGTVALTGTANRVTVSAANVFDISATFEALLGKVANPLSQFAATTSAQLAGVISDEIGTGGLLFSSAIPMHFYIESPTASETKKFRARFPVARTITKLVATVTGASASLTWTIRKGSDHSASGTEVVTGGTTTTGSPATTTGQVITSFNSASIAADDFLWFETTAKSGTVADFQLTIIF